MGANPLHGARLQVVTHTSDYINGGVTTGNIVSDAEGRWTELGSPLMLQPGNSYQFTCLPPRGMRAITAPITGVFPTAVSTARCEFATSPLAKWTHSFTNLVFTAAGGAFGEAVSYEGAQSYGVQYPVDGPSASAPSQLFKGGFFFAVNNQLVNTWPSSNYALCASCSSVGSSVAPTYTTLPDGTKRVVSLLSPTAGPDRGIRVRQETLDGRMGDYILFRLTLTNTSAVRQTVYPGVFMDWDVHNFSNTYVGHTPGVALSGRLAYMTAPNSGFYGTMVLNRTTTGVYLRGNFAPGTNPLSDDQLLQILKGQLSKTTNTGPGDYHYIHGAGPITIRAGAKQDVWIAMIAGSTLSELEANGNNAIADYQARTAP